MLSVGAYVASLALPVVRLEGEETYTGFGWLRVLVTTENGWLFALLHPASWANLTLFLAGYELRKGDADRASPMAIGTLALGASFWFLSSVGLPSTAEVLVGYWVWLGSMIVVVVAPMFIRADP